MVFLHLRGEDESVKICVSQTRQLLILHNFHILIVYFEETLTEVRGLLFAISPMLTTLFEVLWKAVFMQ